MVENENNERKESYDLLITPSEEEKAEAEDSRPADDMKRDEVFKTQRTEGHTFDPHRAEEEGLTYTPPTDPPVLPSEREPQGVEMAAGYEVSLDEGAAPPRQIPDHVRNSDLDVLERIKQALRQNSETGHLNNVKVQVRYGQVNLFGTVDSEDDRRRVQEVVAEINGVAAIKNNLQAEVV